MRETKALIDDATGLVENIIVVDGPFDPGPGKTLMDPTGAQIGGTWDGAKFLPKPEPPPPPPPRFEEQAKAIESATTLDELKTALAPLARAL